MRLPCSPQNVSGSLIEASYMARYIASSIKVGSALIPLGWINAVSPRPSSIPSLQPFIVAGSPERRRARALRRSRLKEPHRLRAIAHQYVLGLLVMVEHHLVVFAPDAGLLIAAERRVRRVEVVAIGPHPSRLDAAAHAIGAVDVAGPHAGAEAVER